MAVRASLCFPLSGLLPKFCLPNLRFRRTSSTVRCFATMAAKKVLVPIATGTEEMEAVIIIDILRRAGADVTVASVEDDLRIVASRKVIIVADAPISSCENQKFDLVVLPGGMPGAERLRDSKPLERIAHCQAEEQRLYGAICAAPAVALHAWGLLEGLQATCHPSFADKLSNQSAIESSVVKDGLVITSRAPGTAMEFALALVEQLYDKEKCDQVSNALVLLGVKAPLKLEFNSQPWTKEKPSILVPIANGTEEMEAVIIIDVLRRAGADVVVASVENNLQIIASRKVNLVADKHISELSREEFDAVFLPGGMPGAERLRDSEALDIILKKQAGSNKVYGAICASPAVVFQPKNMLTGKKATAYPAFQSKLFDQSGAKGRVVIDGFLATSQGPGSAMEFSLSIVEKFFGKGKALSVAQPMLFNYLND